MTSIRLPNSSHDFSNPSYWRRFFEKCQDAPFEWYGDFEQLAAVLEKYLKPGDRILQIGCGNSQLAEQLWDNGYRNVLSIDTDDKVIERMRERHSGGRGKKARTGLEFEVKSAEETGCASESINVVIDKGTIDALLPPNYSQAQGELVSRILEEADRVLNPQAGRFITITLGQKHIIERIMDFFWAQRKDFLLRVHQCQDKDGGGESRMPVFAIVATKLKRDVPKSMPIEFFRAHSTKGERVSRVSDLLKLVEAEQELSWFKHYVATNSGVDDARITLCGAGDDTGGGGKPRFELNVVDDRELPGKMLSYAVFIVPLGRESDWLFSTPRGRQSLRHNCDNKSRLLVVRLYRDQDYPSLGAIQTELSQIAISLKPKGSRTEKIPFLSLGSVSVVERECVAKGESAVTGRWVVDQIQSGEGNGALARQLLFLDNPFMVQSEVEVIKAKKGQVKLFTEKLSFSYHRRMIAALGQCTHEAELKFSVLGLGGGLLARFLYDKFPTARVTCIELDPEVVEVAEKYFDFPSRIGVERLEVIVGDAMDYLKSPPRQGDDSKFDVIFLDLSTTRLEEGLTCPPVEFTSQESFELMRGKLAPGGLLTFNLVARDEQMAKRVKETVKKVFPSVCRVSSTDEEEEGDGDEELNEVILCLSGEKPLSNDSHSIELRANLKPLL